MTIRGRSLSLGLLLAFASVLYGAARYYSPSLVEYVVERTLREKAPRDADSALVHKRFRALLAATPNRDARMEVLERISERLEKVQNLSSEELDGLLADPVH